MKGIKTTIGYIVILCALFFLLGMSGFGGSANQPSTTSAFNAKVLDVASNEVEITSVTIDGKTTFGGYLGKGKVQIPFENITHIEISKGNVCVTLMNGGQICNLKTNEISRLYGNTSFGTYQIALKDIKGLDFIKAKK
jgi:hypothetical protein